MVIESIDSVYQPTTEPHEPEPGNLSNRTTATPSLFSRFIQIFSTVGYTLFVAIAFILIDFCIKVADWCRSCVCPCDLFGKRKLIARELQTLPVTSSMDPIIPHIQYAEPTELPQPDDEKCCTMVIHNDERLNNAGESNRTHNSDRRIVLRPICHIEEV